MQKKLLTLVIALVMAISMTTIASCDEQQASTPDMNTVLATVNGTDITLGDISGAYQYLSQMYQSYGMDVTTAEAQQSLSAYALNMLIQEKVILSKAKELGLDSFTDEEMEAIKKNAETSYEATLTSYKSYFAAEGKTEDEVRADTIAFFNEQGYTLDSLIDSAKNSAAYEKVYNDAVKDVAITEEELKTAYDEGLKTQQESYAADPSAYDSDVSSGKNIFVIPEGIRNVKHILIKLDDAAELKQLQSDIATLEATDDKYKEAQTRIAEIMADVQPKLDQIASRIEAGEDFQTLIDEFGEDGGMKSGDSAVNGYAMSAGTKRYVTEFQNAGMALEKVGDISEPVLSDYGYHIIRYESDVPARVVPFEEIKDSLEASLLSTKKSEAYSTRVNEWMTAADITYAQQLTAEAE